MGKIAKPCQEELGKQKNILKKEKAKSFKLSQLRTLQFHCNFCKSVISLQFKLSLLCPNEINCIILPNNCGAKPLGVFQTLSDI